MNSPTSPASAPPQRMEPKDERCPHGINDRWCSWCIAYRDGWNAALAAHPPREDCDGEKLKATFDRMVDGHIERGKAVSATFAERLAGHCADCLTFATCMKHGCLAKRAPSQPGDLLDKKLAATGSLHSSTATEEEIDRAVRDFARENWAGFAGPIHCQQAAEALADKVSAAARAQGVREGIERAKQAVRSMDTPSTLTNDQAFYWEHSRDKAVLEIRALTTPEPQEDKHDG